MSKHVSRYIPKTIDEETRKVSGFKCAWCGVALTEKHHIEPFHVVQKHEASNLILLCPNCHTEATSGNISEEELMSRRKELTGEVTRSSGSLFIPRSEFQIDVGGNHFLKCKNVLMFNENPLISLKSENEHLLISIRFFNEKGNLTCWMSRNRWWVENSAIQDFSHSKNNLTIKDHTGDDVLNLTVHKNIIDINGYVFVKGQRIRFSREKIEFGQGNQMIGCTFAGENGIVFTDDSDLRVQASMKIKI